MFDIGVGFSELMLLAVIMIIVVGPEDLPALLRTIGRYVGQVRRVADEFKSQLDEAIRETEIDKVKKTVGEVKDGIVNEAGIFNSDLIDFEEHNKKILEQEKRDEECEATGPETATQKVLRESGAEKSQPTPTVETGGGEPTGVPTEDLPARKSGT